LRRHKAHYLNASAALVWQCCQERRSLADTVARVEAEIGIAPATPLVWMALGRLERAHLLSETPSVPRPRSRYTRRQVIQALGRGAAATARVLLIESIVSPVAAEAASCLTAVQCEALAVGQCGGQPICGSPGDCCVVRGNRCRARNC